MIMFYMKAIYVNPCPKCGKKYDIELEDDYSVHQEVQCLCGNLGKMTGGGFEPFINSADVKVVWDSPISRE